MDSPVTNFSVPVTDLGGVGSPAVPQNGPVSGASGGTPFGETLSCRISRIRREKGATFAEYVLLATLIALVAILGVRAFGNRVSTQFSAINESLDEVM